VMRVTRLRDSPVGRSIDCRETTTGDCLHDAVCGTSQDRGLSDED
jgi:hypothetical protein